MEPELYLTIFTACLGFALGGCLGSFASALVWRIPQQKAWFYEINKETNSREFVRSECPSCHRTLLSIDLVPIFSWLFYSGKCRQCKKSIGIIYPALEMAFGAVCFWIFWVFGLTANAFIVSFFLAFLFIFMWAGIKYSAWSREILLILIFLSLLFIVFTGF